MATCKEKSRNADFTCSDMPEIEKVNQGSFQRIADACELMATNWKTLVSERNRYQRWYRSGLERERLLENRVRGLKSAITRFKRKNQ